MKLYVYKLEKILYEGEIDRVTLPGSDGELTVLPQHAAFITTLKAGRVTAHRKNEKAQTWEIDHGFATIDPQSVILLVQGMGAPAD
jgi:F-type H+-transporting ATPase subunit epsilon